jgi:DNA-binding NarL/FixJ family response regulator
VRDIGPRWHEAQENVDRLTRFPAAHAEVLALTLTGNLDEARKRADEYYGYSSAGEYLAFGMSNILTGTVDVAEGRFPDAIARLEEALAALHAEGVAAWSYPARIRLIEAHSALGNVKAAAKALAATEERSGPHMAAYDPEFGIARAWLAAAESMVTRAVKLALTAADSAARFRQHAIEAQALHTAARFGDHSVAGRLADLAAKVDGELVQIYARHAVALASDDGSALDAAATAFEDLGALLSAADASAQAASAHDRAGDRRKMVESAAAANRLSAVCGGARTPALLTAAHPLPLTTREREIANLVAAGLSNKQIADRLTVSVRTVEGHLYRACTKLDVTDREALAALMGGG